MKLKNKILVIDDDEGVLKKNRSLLEMHEYDVLTAESGAMGITIAQIAQPDLILCDITMPGIDGYETLKRMKEFAPLKFIPFIYLTARVNRRDLRKGMELGADDYLFKPCPAEDLLAAVKIRLEKYQALITRPTAVNAHPIPPVNERLEPNDTILLTHKGVSTPIKVSTILYIVSENQYTQVVLLGKQKFLIRRSMAQWEKILPKRQFLRIHRSAIINLEEVERVEKVADRAYKAFLKNSTTVFEISRRTIIQYKKQNITLKTLSLH